jgi:hypothetical protein
LKKKGNEYFITKGTIGEKYIREGLKLLQTNQVYLEILFCLWTTPLNFFTRNEHIVHFAMPSLFQLPNVLTRYFEIGYEFYLEFQEKFKNLNEVKPSNLLDESEIEILNLQKLKNYKLEDILPIYAKKIKIQFKDKKNIYKVKFLEKSYQWKFEYIDPLSQTHSEKIKFPLWTEIWDFIWTSLQYHYIGRLRFNQTEKISVEFNTKRNTGGTALKIILKGLSNTQFKNNKEKIRLMIPFSLPGVFARNWELAYLLNLVYNYNGDAVLSDLDKKYFTLALTFF